MDFFNETCKILNKSVHTINIVRKLYLVSKNVNFLLYNPRKLMKSILVSRNVILLMVLVLQFYSYKQQLEQFLA